MNIFFLFTYLSTVQYILLISYISISRYMRMCIYYNYIYKSSYYITITVRILLAHCSPHSGLPVIERVESSSGERINNKKSIGDIRITSACRSNLTEFGLGAYSLQPGKTDLELLQYLKAANVRTTCTTFTTGIDPFKPWDRECMRPKHLSIKCFSIWMQQPDNYITWKIQNHPPEKWKLSSLPNPFGVSHWFPGSSRYPVPFPCFSKRLYKPAKHPHSILLTIHQTLWPPTASVWMICLFNWVILMFHVNFQGCKDLHKLQPVDSWLVATCGWKSFSWPMSFGIASLTS